MSDVKPVHGPECFSDVSIVGRLISAKQSEYTRSPRWVDFVLEVRRGESPKADVRVRVYEQNLCGLYSYAPEGTEFVAVRGYLCGNAGHNFVIATRDIVFVSRPVKVEVDPFR